MFENMLLKPLVYHISKTNVVKTLGFTTTQKTNVSQPVEFSTFLKNNVAKNHGFTTCSNNQLLNNLTVDMFKINVAKTNDFSNHFLDTIVKPMVSATLF